MIQEALKLVESLNNETFLDGVSLECIEPFNFESNGYQCKISFLGIALWDDDNDDREWLEDNDDEKEPLRNFIIRETKKVLADINKRVALI
jgi:hypothetical protein